VKKCAVQIREPEHRRRAAVCRRPREKGYILLTLLLLVALMAVLAIGIIIPIAFELQREQEQEMIHRGVQYSRAIRTYYKKFGRYPTKLEDLDNTNNLRYLRKRYKDPFNKNQDFKLLHYGDPGVTLGGGFSIGSSGIPGATPAGSPTGLNASGAGGSGSGDSLGNSSGNSGFGNSGVNSSGVFAQSSGSSGNSNSGFGGNSNSQTTSGQGASATPGSDSSQSGSQDTGTAQGQTSSTGQQVIGGGPIVGVASVSKKASIREFNHKRKYSEWQFVYDPTTDRGGLITTPNQPVLQGFGAQPGLNGAQPAAGTNTSPFGGSNGSSFGNSSGNSSGSSFGQSSSFGNNSNSGGSSQPPSNPPQQQ
jgi:type II secretory pathway pseudopilin PulG